MMNPSGTMPRAALKGHVALSQMDTVRMAGQGDIDPVVDDEQCTTAPRDRPYLDRRIVEVLSLESFVAQLDGVGPPANAWRAISAWLNPLESFSSVTT